MASCRGTKTDSRDHRSTPCGTQLYRCNKCGSIGCSYSGHTVTCTAQGFNGGACLKCKSAGGKTNV